ncbi:hypothetical protein AB4072_05480 [Microvirga sp. 2MCAF38]|uniref:cadherin repeat domain-containing protein n=1 Tax=Microvirga sp. 2MCAF38 TaxID=3232989 RepID=UPI003F9D0F08
MLPIDLPQVSHGTVQETSPSLDQTLTLTGLEGDAARSAAGQAVHIDVGSNAVISSASGLVSYMYIVNYGFSSGEHFGLDSLFTRVTATDGLNNLSVISVDGHVIGQVADWSDQWQLTFEFNDEATPERVSQLLHALTYVNSSADANKISHSLITVEIAGPDNSSVNASVTVMTAPDDPNILTAGIDDLVGTAGDDVFTAAMFGISNGDKIAGGEGNDTLQLYGESPFTLHYELNRLATFSGIDTIFGSNGDDVIWFKAGQLADTHLIDGKGGGNLLRLAGADINLVGKTIRNFTKISVLDDNAVITVDDSQTAKLVRGNEADNETLVLTNGILTAAERNALHTTGRVDIIVARETANGPLITTSHLPPAIGALHDDHVRLTGQAPVRLDANQDAVVTANGKLTSLSISVVAGDQDDLLGIDVSGSVTLSNGLAVDSIISVAGTQVGIIKAVDSLQMWIQFPASDTPVAGVQEILRSLTYFHANGAITAPKQISLSLADETSREATITVTVDPGAPVPPPVPVAPTAIEATGSSVAEGAVAGTPVSVLKAIDANSGDTFTYKLLDDAGGRFALKSDALVVADGLKLDFEQATSHSVTVRATDQTGRFVDQRLTIKVSDIASEDIKGSAGNDIFFGGANSDKFAGRDGKDILNGGKGRDIFVFDTKLNKKNNVDKLADFNHRDDTIHLAKSVFSKIAKKGVLAKSAFWIGDSAHDASDRIIYNKKTGALFYDQDGNGAKAAVQFAILPKKLALMANDFFVL